jgi:hypothetical protein
MATSPLSNDVQVASDNRGTVILNVRDGHFYGVNGVGGLILAAQGQGKDL